MRDWAYRSESRALNSTTGEITVLIADANPILRAALTTVVGRSPLLAVVGEAATGQEALESIRRLEPNVAILDLHIPGLDGRQIVAAITHEELPTRALIVSGRISPADAYALIEAGAAGLLLTTAGAGDFVDAVAAVAGSDTVLPREFHTGLMNQIRIRCPEADLLTRREREMLADLALGLSSPAIGRQRNLSPSTVKTYLHQVYAKLGVSDRAAAVAEGMRRGLIE